MFASKGEYLKKFSTRETFGRINLKKIRILKFIDSRWKMISPEVNEHPWFHSKQTIENSRGAGFVEDEQKD